MLGSLFTILDWTGTAVFAVTGALVASRKRMDIFGFILLGSATGIGGGSLRDLMLGATPVFWVREPVYLAICVGVSAATFFLAHVPESRYRVLLWLDAVGLALFCIIGADKALAAGTSGFIAVAMGAATATFGGIIRDLLGGESPLILRKEIYVTAALAGALVFVSGVKLGAPWLAAAGAGFAVCLTVRALALVYGWSLPVYRARAGRTAEEIEKRKR
ncbi:MAG: trimeric intracellular cation channel family protein [Pseudolabrys sp.]